MPEAVPPISISLATAAVRRGAEETAPAFAADAARFRRLIDEHHAFVWRSMRRLGVPAGDVDDAVQKLFVTVSNKLGAIDPARERSFLFATAARIASNERRAESRKRSVTHEGIDEFVGDEPTPEEAAGDRALLDKLLSSLSIELRAVFVLFELEQLTAQEISELLDVPTGTIKSRLRRAREIVEAASARLGARDATRTREGAP